jgi:hypothetical protein
MQVEVKQVSVDVIDGRGREGGSRYFIDLKTK